MVLSSCETKADSAIPSVSPLVFSDRGTSDRIVCKRYNVGRA